jgi:hypothetical protein
LNTRAVLGPVQISGLIGHPRQSCFSIPGRHPRHVAHREVEEAARQQKEASEAAKSRLANRCQSTDPAPLAQPCVLYEKVTRMYNVYVGTSTDNKFTDDVMVNASVANVIEGIGGSNNLSAITPMAGR